MSRPTCLGAGVALLLAVALAASPASATSLVAREELPALVEESERGVLAEVIRVHYGKDKRNLHSTWVTLRIEDLVYGRSSKAGKR